MNEKELIWNPLRAGYLENPHTQLSLLRERNPVHRGINGSWILFKYDDVKLVLNNPTFVTWKTPEVVASKNRYAVESENFDALSTILKRVLLFLDPPMHTEIRLIITKIWNSYNFQKDIEEVVCNTFDRFSGKNEIDVIKDFATVIPTTLICRILGLPPKDYFKLKNWSYQFISSLEPFVTLPQLREYNQNAAEFHEYMIAIIQAKELEPDDSFIGKLIVANETLEKRLTRDEIISILCLLFFAGIETSVNQLSQSILALIKNPEQVAILNTNEILPPQAVNELLRYVSPTQYTKRTATEEVEIRGVRMKAGTHLTASIFSANFDPDVFENPEKFDLTRIKNPHLSFGHGMHYCVGAKLARDELSIALPALFSRYPQIALSTTKKYEWDRLIMSRNLKSLPVILN